MPKKQVGYIDAFVLVVPKSKTRAYKKMAKDAAKIWMKHGALSYKECMGEELDPDAGGCHFLPFDKLTKLKEDETVWFSYIEYESKRHRNQVNKKVFAEMSKNAEKCEDTEMPFDLKRMAWGGFKMEVGS